MSDPFQANIYVTSNCNRACPKCFYTRSFDPMNIEIAQRLGDWVVSTFKEKQTPEFRIHFLGGEPTLNLDAVYSIVDRISQNRPEYTLPTPDGAFVLFTNGDFLTESILRTMREKRIFVMLNPSDDSLAEVQRKVTLIKKNRGGCSLAISLDDLNIARLPELTKLALQNHCNLRVNRLYDGALIPGYVDEYKKQMGKMFELLLKSEWTMWPNFIMESTYPTFKGPKNPNACGRWFIAVDPDGTIRSCNADLDTKVGHIENTKFSDIKFPHRWSAKNLPECQGCEWVTWCQGGCPYTRKLTYGTYNKKSPFCEAFKALFPMLMELTKRWLISEVLKSRDIKK